MRKIINYQIINNQKIAKETYEMILEGDTSWIKKPGQFINLTIEGSFLKRPISICDYNDSTITIIYKIVGQGTSYLSKLTKGKMIETMIDLGNGFTINKNYTEALLIGGGVGVPPLYNLAKQLIAEGIKPTVVLGFTKAEQVFYQDKFKALDINVYVCCMDGKYGISGMVTDVITKYNLANNYYYACGPKVMLQAIYKLMNKPGQISLEARMGCGYGSCMGCSIMTKKGPLRICKEGPVLESEILLWED